MPAYDPFFSTNPVVASIEAHRGKVEQTRENSARLAAAYAAYDTKGNGEFLLEEPHLFGCTFVEQPVVGYGFSIKQDDGQDVLVPGTLPRGSGGVRRWVKDVRGYYTGAYVFFTVDTAPVVQTTVDETDTPQDAPLLPPFTDDFGRPDAPIPGNGWITANGDFFVNTERVITRDDSAYMGRPYGRVSMTVQADLRSPDDMQPGVFCWGTSSGGGTKGYLLSFSPTATGAVNVLLRKDNVIVAGSRFGPVGTAIGNVFKTVTLRVIEDEASGLVKCLGTIDGRDVLNYESPIASSPTGMYAGVGNWGGPGSPTGGTVFENVIIAEYDVDVPPPLEPVVSTPVPDYDIQHDFSFTGIAIKDLPEYLLDPSADA